MEIGKAIAASIRGLGLAGRPSRSHAAPPGPEAAPPPTRAELRVQRANLRLLAAARSTLLRTAALLK